MPPSSLRRGNLFAPPPAEPAAGEVFENLLAGGPFRLERIVSTGQTTAPDEWYDQTADEWVALLTGSATLRFADPDETFDLTPGDWMLIPARRRHRVERTDADEPSVWLAVHFKA